MEYKIDRNRLSQTFITLCEIDSPSRREKGVADYLRRVFLELGASSVTEDNSAEQTGSNTGNLIVRFDSGRPDHEKLFFCCHMDTVEPGSGVKVDLSDGLFTSRGETILGGDDKSGIAAIIEMVHLLQDNRAAHDGFELIFTTCEEVGLLGAKALDHSSVRARYGYALDSTGINRVITGAPAANRMKIEVHGIAAHAGLNPENGVSAFCLAARAIADLRLGRLDDQSTANFGLIQGGIATNIVPDLITIEGEVRSHSVEKLKSYTKEIESTFLRVTQDWIGRTPSFSQQPWVDVRVQMEYPAMRLDDGEEVIRRVAAAGNRLGRQLNFEVAGGGSDANILNDYGLATAIIATGMNKVHTTDECLKLDDLCSLTELLYQIVTL
ncbi:MAG: M20/M25/M40 family metallo-hydrolase [Thermodesulfobacteriota bacterium]